MRSMRFGPSLLLASALLGGCASTMSPTQMVESSRIQPYQAVSHGASDVQVHYAVGKQRLGEGRFASAREEFLRALSLDNGNAEVRNGLASAYVQLGDVDRAIEQLELAVAAAPEASHLQSNLGYALYLKGSYRDAARALHRALSLDAGNDKARQNWLALQQKVNGGNQVAEREQPAPALAAAIPPLPAASAFSHVLNIDFQQPAAAPVFTVRFDSGTPPMLAGRSPAQPVEPDVVALTPVVTLGPTAGLPVRQIERRAPGAPEVVVTPLQQPGATGIRRVSLQATDRPRELTGLLLDRGEARIEVSNGNGVALMATRLTHQFRALDVRIARITNADHFRHAVTQIYFREGYVAEALELKRMLPVDAEILRADANQLIDSVDVRIVVGRDLLSQKQVERVRRVPPAPLAGDFDLSNG